MADDMINKTKEVPKAGPLADTLDHMTEFDINKLNRTHDKKKD